MADWKLINEAPAEYYSTPGSLNLITVLLWIKDGGFGHRDGTAALGYIYKREGGEISAQASGFNGKWEITHWAPVGRPEGV